VTTVYFLRSAIHKQLNGRLVLRWVTTWESLVLYFCLLVLHPHRSALYRAALVDTVYYSPKITSLHPQPFAFDLHCRPALPPIYIWV